MKGLQVLFALFLAFFSAEALYNTNSKCLVPVNNCVSFSVSSGTGCAWMCNYCAQQLGTNNYYFQDGVCKYDPNQGTCVGSPLTGVTYTCCSA